MDREQAAAYARDWAEAWNRRDLEAVLSHFADDVVFSSPRALEAVGAPAVSGKPALRRYWQAALQRAQVLRFELRRVLWDDAAGELAIVYDREIDGRRDRALELLCFGAAGRVVRGEVFYGVVPPDGDALARFIAYAAAFERTYVDDDWSRLETYFTEDAVYRVLGGPPLGGEWRGRDALLAQMRASVNALDRRFDERRVELLGAPSSGPDFVEVAWRATYRKLGLPDLVFEGVERAELSGGRIRRLEDRMEAGAGARVREYAARHLA